MAGKAKTTLESNKKTTETLGCLLRDIRACRICRDEPKNKPLPHEPHPVLRVSSSATICICGQAPGTRVHSSGIPFTDPSGDRLRDWMGLSEDEFYDEQRVAIIPMGFCFPGLDAKGGDLPPRRECAKTWHGPLFNELSDQFQLILLVGQYAQKWHLGKAAARTLTETVADWRAHLDDGEGPSRLPLPHPSWRNNAWIKKHAWFETDLLPRLKKEVQRALGKERAAGRACGTPGG